MMRRVRARVREREEGGRLQVGLLIAALIAIALALPSAASSVLGGASTASRPAAGSSASAAPKWYFRVTAERSVGYKTDWGNDPSHSYNGSHSFSAEWQLFGIGSMNRYPGGYQIGWLTGGVIVRGNAQTFDNVTVINPLGPRTARCPRAAAGGGQIIEHAGRGPQSGLGRFAPARAYLAITGRPSHLRIHPGSTVPFREHCYDTEDLATHALQAQPGFDVPAPAASRFRGRTPFNYHCSDDYAHNDSHHDFSGGSNFRITIAPFPAKALKANLKALRDRIGTNPRRPSQPIPEDRVCG